MIVPEMFHVKHSLQGRTVAAALLMWSALVACSPPDDMAAATATSAQAASATATGGPRVEAGAKAEAAALEDNAEKDGGSREFAYTWPSQVSAIPALAKRLAAERDNLLAEQKADWDEALREYANGNCVSCINRSFEKTWEVVADLPRYLSLSASFWAYTGGAHGNGAYDALVWDRETKAPFDPKAMFISHEALQDALGASWCQALQSEQIVRLGRDYSDDSIFPCPPIADLTVLVGSSDARKFNRIGLLAAPYVAGSYAEGTYEVTLPVTPAVLAAVRPEHVAAFATAK